MSDTSGNNPNGGGSMMKEANNSPNSYENSQNLETSNNYANQPNGMNSYNRNSTYGSYNGYNSGSGSGYGYGSSYGSGYGSGYGSSYGSGYGSSYGGYGGYGSSYGGSGYGSGYSSYGGANQYSNTYSKPMQQGQQGQQGQQNVPPPNFRHDVWGFLNGFHAILNVLYAGTGIVHFGKMFMKMSIKIIKMVFGKSAGLVYKLTGFQFLKNIMQKFSTKGDWLGEFNVADNPLENVWSNNGPESVNTNKTFFGKFMLVLRILSLMGGIVAFFLRRKVAANHQHPPVQIEMMDPEIPQVNLKPGIVEMEGIKSFYDEVKLIEQDHADELRDVTSMNEVLEEVNKEVQSDSKEAKDDVEIKEEVGSPKNESIEEKTSSKLIEEVLNQDEDNQIAVISSAESQEVMSLTPPELLKTEIPESQQDFAVKNTSEVQVSLAKEQIVSEDFWKNEEVFKKIESIQKENSQKAEAKEDNFELPSVLKSLRSASSTATKPWLMKKKKNPEPAPETSATVPETIVQTLPSETITPEMPSVEAKKENPEVVEIPNTVENPIEGTA